MFSHGRPEGRHYVPSPCLLPLLCCSADLKVGTTYCRLSPFGRNADPQVGLLALS